MLTASRSAHALSHHFHNDPRSMRIAAEIRKLAAAARSYLVSRARMFVLGEDPLVQALVSAAGLGEFDAHVIRAGVDGRIVTAVCVPTRIWRDAESRRRLIELKQEAKVLRTSVILVPQRWLRAEIRGSVARVLNDARNTPYSRRQMSEVVEHLRNARISTLIETAEAIGDHDDPIGAVLAMVCYGVVDIDRSGRIDARTWTAAALHLGADALGGPAR